MVPSTVGNVNVGPAVEAINLVKYFDDTVAVDDVSFEVDDDGQLVVVDVDELGGIQGQGAGLGDH